MINPGNKIQIPVVTLVITGISAFLIIILCFSISNYKKSFNRQEVIRLKMELDNQRLINEKKQLELQIENYKHFSDSISSVIESNNKITAIKIKALIQLSNDELRKIANDQ